MTTGIMSIMCVSFGVFAMGLGYYAPEEYGFWLWFTGALSFLWGLASLVFEDEQ